MPVHQWRREWKVLSLEDMVQTLSSVVTYNHFSTDLSCTAICYFIQYCKKLQLIPASVSGEWLFHAVALRGNFSGYFYISGGTHKYSCELTNACTGKVNAAYFEDASNPLRTPCSCRCILKWALLVHLCTSMSQTFLSVGCGSCITSQVSVTIYVTHCLLFFWCPQIEDPKLQPRWCIVIIHHCMLLPYNVVNQRARHVVIYYLIRHHMYTVSTVITHCISSQRRVCKAITAIIIFRMFQPISFKFLIINSPV